MTMTTSLLTVAYIGVPSFIVTLGGLLIWRGLIFRYAQGQTIAPMDSTFRLLGGGPDAFDEGQPRGEVTGAETGADAGEQQAPVVEPVGLTDLLGAELLLGVGHAPTLPRATDSDHPLPGLSPGSG